MLTYLLEHGSEKPMYEVLYEKIKEDIISGRIPGGEKLPSKRAFARQLRVSTITVENAYAQLITEGFVESAARKGYFAADLGSFAGTVPAGATQKQEDEPIPEREWFADFAGSQTRPESFPFTTWAKISREILTNCREELMHNTPQNGAFRLREAIADHLRAFRGLQADPDQIVIGAGTDYLYGLLIQLLGFEKKYVYENPGYRKIGQVLNAYHVSNAPVSMDRQGISVSSVKQQDADIVHATPAHHFPTGITMSAARRFELLEWASEKEGRYILEDDYDCEFRMSGRPLPTLFGLDRGRHVIYMNTFTRSLASTIRISYMVLPKELMELCRKKLGFYSCSVPVLEQYTLTEFIRRGCFEQHINRMRSASRKLRDYLLQEIADSPLGSIASVYEEDAGLHFLLNLALKIPAEEFLRRLDQEDIHMQSLARYVNTSDPTGEEARLFRLGELGDTKAEHTFFVSYSFVPRSRIREAVRRIARAAGAGTDTEGGT